jgi:hypothetical protein
VANPGYPVVRAMAIHELAGTGNVIANAVFALYMLTERRAFCKGDFPIVKYRFLTGFYLNIKSQIYALARNYNLATHEKSTNAYNHNSLSIILV